MLFDFSPVHISHVYLIMDTANGMQFISHATDKETTQVVQWINTGKIKYDDRYGYLINNTYYTRKDESQRFFICDISWYVVESEQDIQPFFMNPEQLKLKPIEKQEKLLFSRIDGVAVATLGMSSTGFPVNEVIGIIERNFAVKPLAIKELEVDKDVVIKSKAKFQRPSFIREDGSYDAEQHRLECEELQQMYATPMTLLQLTSEEQQTFRNNVIATTTALANSVSFSAQLNKKDAARLDELIQTLD